jgi:hypothetical protein
LSRKLCTGAALICAALVFLLALPVAAASHAPQEDGRAERPEVDPYTEGDAKAMERLGIQRFGPFRFGDGRTTEVIATQAGGVPFLWIETAHFQLGCSLEPISMPEDPAAKKRLQAELKELSKRLPNVPRRIKKIDSWLLLHLYAARLERLFEAFVTELQLEDLAAADPYLGSGGPFCILLTEKKSTFSRYTLEACGSASESTQRFYFDKPAQQLFYGAAFEALQGDLHQDEGLHFAMVHGVTKVLAESVRGYGGVLPTWLSAGLAHYFARNLVSDEILLYTTPRGESGRGKDDSNFAVKVRGRVSNKVYPTFEEMEAWTDPGAMRFADHMITWSKIDFMLRADKGSRAHAFLWAISEPIAWDIKDRAQVLLDQTHTALLDIAGGDLMDLDQAWADWVLDEYPKR